MRRLKHDASITNADSSRDEDLDGEADRGGAFKGRRGTLIVTEALIASHVSQASQLVCPKHQDLAS